MKSTVSVASVLMLISGLGATAIAQDKKEEKKKAERVSGDVGLLDLEKKYMILVTKEGKLITLQFNEKTKSILLKEEKAKMSDIGLGAAAAVEYVEKGDKKNLTAIEFTPAKGAE